jgi:hypothetical protein
LPLPRLEPGERATVLRATAALCAIVAAHAVRETARDAIFLASLPARSLPWAYLAIAAMTLAAGAASGSLRRRVSHLRLLEITLLLGVAIDVGFWWLTASTRPAVLFSLYVWTGLFSTALVAQFWLLLASVIDVGQAKRLFPWIGAGGLAGAVLGSTAASGLLLFASTRALIPAAACVTAAVLWICRSLRAEVRVATPPEASTDPERRRELLADSYLLRLLGLALLVAMISTGGDFLFKTLVTREIEAARLGHFFARFGACVNLAALAFQIVVSPRLLQRAGVIRAVGVLPGLLLATSAATAAVPVLAPVLLLKGVDAVVRHSLHRAGTEILYLPLSSRVRDSFKTLVESVGQRGGQALASLGILGAVTLHAEVVPIAVALSVLSALALLTLVGLRDDYLDRFRDRLRTLVGDTRTDVPELDLSSLETLVSTLSSPSDAEVLAALDLLESYGRTRLVPPLILHHPSNAVVLRALELLGAADHPHLGALRERLLEHEVADVRAAVLRTWPGAGPDAAVLLRVLREDPSPAVRATALAGWASRTDSDPRVLERTLGELMTADRIEGRLALASALPKLPAGLASRFAHELAADPSPAVAEALASTLGAKPELRFVPVLVELLPRREAREPAREAIVALGEEGLAALARLLEAPETTDAVRRHLPRTISRVPGAAAARILTYALGRSEPRVRYKILRGLGRMRATDPALEIDAAPLLAEARASLERAVTMLRLQIAYALRTELAPAATRRVELLAPLLEEKEQAALERAFRVLHILEPERDYAVIFDALGRGDAAFRAICHELLEQVADVPIRDAMLALTSSGTPLERLRDVLGFFEPEGSARLVELASAASRASDPSDPERLELAEAASRVLAEAARDHDAVLTAVLAYQLPERVGASAGGRGYVRGG